MPYFPVGAAFVGVYPTAAAKSPDSVTTEKITPSQAGQLAEMETLKIKGITYYLVQNEAQLRAIGTGNSVNAPVKRRIAADFFLKFIIALILSFNSCLFSLNVTAPRFSLYFPTADIALSRVFP